MEKLIEDFAVNFTKKWNTLNEGEILHSVLNSFMTTRISCDSKKLIPNQFGIFAFFIKPNENYRDIESLEIAWNIKTFRKFPKVVKNDLV